MGEPSAEALQRPSARRGLRLVFVMPLLIFSGLALVFLVQLFGGDPSRVPSALIGRPVPAFTLPPLPGLAREGVLLPGLAAADLRSGGQVTVVNVWASWCAPCREEHPALMELARERNVRVVGINYKDAPENARRFLGALGNPFSAVGVDATGRTAIDWGVYGVPETFIVDAAGTIRHKHIGPILPEQMAEFRRKLGEAAASPAVKGEP